jgi:NAD(P)-dependent dehydrogenase (short-subunit alcohol dehydrogenase family)
MSGAASEWAGRVVVITGAGSGIGRACAHAYAQRGARLHLVDRRLDRVEQVREECRQRRAEATSHTLDCADASSMEQLADWIFEREGRVDVLQNGVGVLVAAPVEQLTLADWRRAVDANLWTVIHGVHAFVPRMLAQRRPDVGEQRRAALVNIASAAGLCGFPYGAPYVASKFAVVGMGEALSAELHGRGLSVLTVCPGMVQSNLLRDGLLSLPRPWRERVDKLYRGWALRPELLARQIVRALREDRSLLVSRFGPAPLWLLKRAAGQRYDRWARRLVARITRP